MSYLSHAVRVDIEQAMARGESNARIMAEHRISYDLLRLVKDNMLTGDKPITRLPTAVPPPGQPPAPQPADEATISALLAELFPTQGEVERRRVCVAELTSLGLPVRAIAERLSIPERAVHRHQATMRRRRAAA